MNSLQSLIKTWLILVLLTIISVVIGSQLNFTVAHKTIFIIIVSLIVALKGQQIIDVFMELKNAPNKWRWLLLSYIIIVPSVITLIYLW